MSQNAWIVALFPLLAFIIIVFVTYKARLASGIVALISCVASLTVSLIILFEKISNPIATEGSINWLSIPSTSTYKGLTVRMGILIDPLSALMIFIVTIISTMVILYSMSYMKGDNGYSRYFAFISLFVFSMLGIVISNNYFQTLVFWELVGLCSYLLIGFWYNKPSAADASKKAFITNRWADFGFLIGIILLFVRFGTFNFMELSSLITHSTDLAFLTIVGILIFIGPIGKSAQFPLHVWLPDAMEGPTPVSALIHAATMVAAGVFLIARGFVLFASAPGVLTVITYVGAFTAFFAATIALVQFDIKRILAYSTLSQLGYMIMAMGLGSMTAGMFHLTTHAFFKALLFLGAGSVIHVLNEQNIFNMGGLHKKMPVTTWTFVIGALALSGIFPLAGFWSKDEIFVTALNSGYVGLFALALFVSFLTPYYMFRLIFLVFFGKENSGHIHESPKVMIIPLIILSGFSVVVGFINLPWLYKGFGHFIYFERPESVQISIWVAVISNIIAIAGIGAAWIVYERKAIDVKIIKEKLGWLYKLLVNKYYIDELYHWMFKKVVLKVSNAFNWIDHNIIDGIFDGMAKEIRVSGVKSRVIQTGLVQNYALIIFAAVVIITLMMTMQTLGGFSR